MSDDNRLLDFDWIHSTLEQADIYGLLADYDDPPADLPPRRQ